MNETTPSLFQEVKLADLSFNPFTLIDKEWMLIASGDSQAHNAMTASWGGLGVLWKTYVSFIFVRPQRFSMQFLEKSPTYSLCFYDKVYRPALAYFGSHSGKDVDKDAETGLTPLYDEAAPYYKESRLVFFCRKMHKQPIDPACFTDPTIDSEIYPQKDYHHMFVGEITKVLMKRD